MVAPGFAQELGFDEGVEHFKVEMFVVGVPVECFAECVLPGLAGFDIADADLIVVRPIAEVYGDQFGGRCRSGLRWGVSRSQLRSGRFGSDAILGARLVSRPGWLVWS